MLLYIHNNWHNLLYFPINITFRYNTVKLKAISDFGRFGIRTRRRVAKGGRGGEEGGGENCPPARLKQVQFALKKKLFWCYAFSGAMP